MTAGVLLGVRNTQSFNKWDVEDEEFWYCSFIDCLCFPELSKQREIRSDARVLSTFDSMRWWFLSNRLHSTRYKNLSRSK
jgi:hypothetical protein